MGNFVFYFVVNT